MGHELRRRLAFVLGVAALLALAGWQWRSDHAQQATLLRVAPAAVDDIRLQLATGTPLHYQRRQGHWYGDDGRPADAGWLDELAALAATPVQVWRPLADFQLARIGLAPAQSELRLNGQRIAFGTLEATAPLRYVRVGGRIALVAADAAPRPPPAMAAAAPP